MAITPDQRATLQLLLERGQRYSDLAALLSVDEAEVRARARAALTELGGTDPDRNVALTDYMLGQADPIGRADASRHLRDSAEDHALASTLAERLRELFPGADLPRLPGEPRQGRFARKPARDGRAKPGPAPARGDDKAAVKPRVPALDSSQSRLIAILASAALLLIVVVLAVTGVFSGDDEGSASTDTATTTTEDGGETAAAEEAVPIQLQPVGGSDAGGAVVFGLASADQPFIEFQIRSLEPPTNEDAYVLWFLSEGGRRGFPLPTPIPVNNDGTVSERIPVPAEILGFAQQAQTITIALNNRVELDDAINRAVRQGQGALAYPGGTVLEARIPRGGGGGEAG